MYKRQVFALSLFDVVDVNDICLGDKVIFSTTDTDADNPCLLYTSPLVDDKVQTKTLANKVGINTPGLIGTIEFQHEVKNLLSIIKDYTEFVICLLYTSR